MKLMAATFYLNANPSPLDLSKIMPISTLRLFPLASNPCLEPSCSLGNIPFLPPPSQFILFFPPNSQSRSNHSFYLFHQKFQFFFFFFSFWFFGICVQPTPYTHTQHLKIRAIITTHVFLPRKISFHFARGRGRGLHGKIYAHFTSQSLHPKTSIDPGVGEKFTFMFMLMAGGGTSTDEVFLHRLMRFSYIYVFHEKKKTRRKKNIQKGGIFNNFNQMSAPKEPFGKMPDVSIRPCKVIFPPIF